MSKLLLFITIGIYNMKFIIKEWDNNTISLMTEAGNVLGYFPSIHSALTTCEEWYLTNNKEPKHEIKIQGRPLTPQSKPFSRGIFNSTSI